MNGAILVVEDTETDLTLLKHGLKKAGVDNPVIEARNGDEARQYLSGEAPFQDRERYPLPCLIITDLNMPHSDGFDLLRWLQSNPGFNGVPRLVLSSSGLERDRSQAAQLGACGYFVKPMGIQNLIDLARHIDEAWIQEHCR